MGLLPNARSGVVRARGLEGGTQISRSGLRGVVEVAYLVLRKVRAPTEKVANLRTGELANVGG